MKRLFERPGISQRVAIETQRGTSTSEREIVVSHLFLWEAKKWKNQISALDLFQANPRYSSSTCFRIGLFLRITTEPLYPEVGRGPVKCCIRHGMGHMDSSKPTARQSCFASGEAVVTLADEENLK